jgi:predicted XRE-type DNA-binding protein
MPKANTTKDTSPSQELAELVSIKRLLAFALLKSGATQKEVAVALGVAQSSISKMFAGGLPRQVSGKAGD